jgi:hypothetical protein
LTSIIAGLGVARISFVFRYLPGYAGSVMRMLELRDGSFDTFSGLVVGIAVVLFFLIRHKEIRRPLLLATAAGLAAWGAEVAATDGSTRPVAVPAVSLPKVGGGQ